MCPDHCSCAECVSQTWTYINEPEDKKAPVTLSALNFSASIELDTAKLTVGKEALKKLAEGMPKSQTYIPANPQQVQFYMKDLCRYYMVRQISTGKFLPELLHNCKTGYTRTKPTFEGKPRLHSTRKQARLALYWWLEGAFTGDFQNGPKKVMYQPDRPKGDFEVVEVELTVIKDQQNVSPSNDRNKTKTNRHKMSSMRERQKSLFDPVEEGQSSVESVPTHNKVGDVVQTVSGRLK